MKALLLATVPLLALALPADAALQICVAEDGGAASCSAVNSTGALTFAPSLTNFANVTIASSGVPIENSPDLATTDLSADTISGFTGSHSLDIRVFQTGLMPVNANLQSTFTVNNLIGTSAFAGPSTLTDYTGGSGTTLGTQLHSDTFAAVAIGAAQFGPTSVAGITSDAQEFVVDFTQAGQSVTDTIQTIGVVATAEPSSLALVGLGVLALGLIAPRRRREGPYTVSET
jgi:hypothetical protein